MTMVRVARSRKPRRCQEAYGPWAHDPTINPGDLYVTLTMPPGEAIAEGVGEGWLTMRLCPQCALGGGTDPTFAKVCAALASRGHPVPPPRRLR